MHALHRHVERASICDTSPQESWRAEPVVNVVVRRKHTRSCRGCAWVKCAQCDAHRAPVPAKSIGCRRFSVAGDRWDCVVTDWTVGHIARGITFVIPRLHVRGVKALTNATRAAEAPRQAEATAFGVGILRARVIRVSRPGGRFARWIAGNRIPTLRESSQAVRRC